MPTKIGLANKLNLIKQEKTKINRHWLSISYKTPIFIHKIISLW